MSCCHGKQSGECVCAIVKKIIDAQDAVLQDDCCTTGCEQSIDKLLNPTSVTPANNPTTIPFVLYCKSVCDLFFATGIKQTGDMQNPFDCINTPVFKAKKLKKNCCAELELLDFQTQGPPTPPPASDDCPFIPGNATGQFVETGICITVDLHCFCAIQCLDPVTPVAQAVVNGNGKPHC